MVATRLPDISPNSPTDVAIAYLRSALNAPEPDRQRFAEFFAARHPEYYRLDERARRAFAHDNLPFLLRGLVAQVILRDVVPEDQIPYDASPLPIPPSDDPLDNAAATFAAGVADSWARSLDKAFLYHHTAEAFHALVDPLGVNWKYGFFLDTPTLEHADWLATHPAAVAYVKSGQTPKYYSNLVWDTYIDRFGTEPFGRPAREPNTRLIDENLDTILNAHLPPAAPETPEL